MKNRNFEALNLETFSRNSFIQKNKTTAAELLLNIPTSQKIKNETINSINYLNTHFPFIRVLVTWTIAGVGHQSSSLEVVRQLRYLGYKGHIQIIWDDWDPKKDEKKFSCLLSSFSGDMKQFPYSYDIRFHEKYKKQFLNECELSITGGHDYSSLAPEEARSKVSLILQPYQWLFEKNSIESIERCIVFKKQDTKNNSIHLGEYVLSELNSLSFGHHYNHTYFSPFPFIEKFIENQLQENENNFHTVNNLINSINLTITKLLHLQISYYLRVNAPVILANLIFGIKKVQKNSSFLKQGVLIFVIDENFAQNIGELMRKIGYDIRICEINDVNLTYPEPGEITIWFSDRLPEAIYTLLLKVSTLPPLFEGANNINKILSMAMIKPSVAYMSYKVTKMNEGVMGRVKTRCDNIADSLNQDHYSDKEAIFSALSIAQFIIDSFDKNSLLNQYFFGLARQILMPNHNLTTAGINEVVRFFKKRKYNHKNKKSPSEEVSTNDYCKSLDFI